MRGRLACGILVIAFAIAVGHLTYHTAIGPRPLPEYIVGGDVTALAPPNPDARQLYLRHNLFLAQQPTHAWIQILAYDRVRLYVNGRFQAEQFLDGFPVALMVDLAPLLHAGHNSLAITARQSSVDHAPAVAVDGGYTTSDGNHRITASDHWKCHTLFDRNAVWWFKTEFDDHGWAEPRRIACNLWGKVKRPPRAVSVPSTAKWITAGPDRPDPAPGNGRRLRGPTSGPERVCFHRAWDVSARPQQAWLRITATCSYRLAINGNVLDEQEALLHTTLPVPPVERLYDITGIVQKGRNALAIALTAISGPPRLLADLEVEDSDGERVALGTDRNWLAIDQWPEQLAQISATKTPDFDRAHWKPSEVLTGDLDVPRWQPQRQDVELELPLPTTLRNLTEQLTLIAAIAALTFLACGWVSRPLRVAWENANLGAEANPASGWFWQDWNPATRVVYLALAPSTIAIAAGILAIFDPRIAAQDVYQVKWIVLAVLSVPVQWVLLAALACQRRAPRQRVAGSRLLNWATLVVGALMVIGFWLRFETIETTPRQWDEAENYNATMKFLETGFPCLEVHKDLPLLYIHTSELQFVPMAVTALFFTDDRYIVRLPMVVFGTLTIGLLYIVGRRIFAQPVGLLAAALYTFSPVCIGMSSFGRYFSQVQFFTLLTLYWYWAALEGTGPLNRRAIWLATISFIAMFLSWEGAALIAPGMMAAALVHRWRRWRGLLGSGTVWAAVVVAAMAVLLQYSYSQLVKTQFLWYGTSISDLTLKPMWRFPNPQPWYYVLHSSWTQDALLPLLGLLGAALLAIRHPFRAGARFLLTLHLLTCLIMAMTLPGLAWRYIYHLVPVPILLGSATTVALARGLARLARSSGLAQGWQYYARGIGWLTAVGLAVLASGLTLQLPEMQRLRVEGFGVAVLKFPDFEGPVRYVSAHLEEGDIVLATDPFYINHLMSLNGHADKRCAYWLATALRFPATIDDKRSLPLDRRDGTPMLASEESLESVVARHSRVWAIIQPERHEVLNDRDVSIFLRQHMQVVYEDWESMVLVNADHRPAFLRLRDEKALHSSQAELLP